MYVRKDEGAPTREGRGGQGSESLAPLDQLPLLRRADLRPGRLIWPLNKEEAEGNVPPRIPSASGEEAEGENAPLFLPPLGRSIRCRRPRSGRRDGGYAVHPGQGQSRNGFAVEARSCAGRGRRERC